MTIVTPIETFHIYGYKDESNKHISIFLAGTIDNGDGENWQGRLIDNLVNSDLDYGETTVIFNPRRHKWDKDAGKEEIIKQIEWEQKYLEECDLIVMNLLDDSKSPISLLELGQYAASGKMIVFCSPKFYRYDNVKFICEKYYIPLIEDNSSEQAILNGLLNTFCK